jgi:hypothetical protein
MKKFKYLLGFSGLGAFLALSVINVRLGSASHDKVLSTLSTLEAITANEYGIPDGGCAQNEDVACSRANGELYKKVIKWTCVKDATARYCKVGKATYSCTDKCKDTEEEAEWTLYSDSIIGRTCN